MLNILNRPKSVKIDIELLKPEEVESHINTTEITRRVMEKLNLIYNKELADDLDKDVRFYMVVKKNKEYDVISGYFYEPFIEKHGIALEAVLTDKANECIDHYTEFLYQQHKKHAAKLPTGKAKSNVTPKKKKR